MENFLLSISYQDPLWIAIAFAFGLLVKQIQLPPMVGFLAAGFVLKALGAESGEFLLEIADLGVTLLLFTIGLKLRLGNLLKPEIWATTGAHMLSSTVLTTALIMGLGALGVVLFDSLSLMTALIVAFALSFSSTVFAVKSLEDRGAMLSRYGQVAIGVLVMQDIAAVIFLAASTGKLPEIWALGLLVLIPLRPLLIKALDLCGHRELLSVFGFVLALGGAALFELVGMKGDLGALIFGLLLAGSKKNSELAGTLLGFKDVFLVCFFLTIGLTGLPTLQTVLAAAILLLLIPVKTALFFALLTRFGMRTRGATLSSLLLANYSEFGLIVAAIAISADWLDSQWLTVIALTLSVSFVIAAPFNVFADKVYERLRHRLKRYQGEKRITGDEDISLHGVSVLIFGMGRVGRSAYDQMRDVYGDAILGIDLDDQEVARLTETGRKVVMGDATNPEFWSRVGNAQKTIDLILLAMPFHGANMAAVTQLRSRGYAGPIVATARYADHKQPLLEAGADNVFDIYAEAGTGAASHMKELLSRDTPTQAPAG